MEPRMIPFQQALVARRPVVRDVGISLLLVAAAVVASVGVARANPVQAAAAGDIVLLDFSASWCGPCRSMAPLVAEVESAGWVVRHIDVDREGDLVRRFGITGVPCYVLLVKGQEVGRINGATTHDEMEKLLAKSRDALGLPGATPASPVAATAPEQRIPGIPLPATAANAPLATEPAAPPIAAVAATVQGSPPVAADRESREAVERLPG